MDKKLQKPDTNFTIAYTVDDSFDNESFIKLRLRVCHDGLSPNKTHFEKKVMEDAKDSIKNKPILAHVKYDENGTPMLGSHDMHVESNRLREGEEKVIYDEIPIGVIPEDCNFTIEEFDGMNYVFCDSYIWRDYSNYAEELIEDAVNTKLSMEISIPDDCLSFNAKERYWEITKFKFRGVTMLNENLGTGMKNALATTENFSQEEYENSVRERMIILMEALQDCLSNYNKEILNKGGNELTKFEELLQKYKITKEDVTFDIEGLTDEELEAKFEEVLNTATATTDAEGTPVTEEFTDEDVIVETPVTEEGSLSFKGENTETAEPKTVYNYVKSFEISHDDVRAGLYALLTSYEEADNTWYYIQSVYDTHFIYRSYASNGNIYKQTYAKDGDNISLSGERTELFEELLTASEKAQLSTLRSNYAELQEFKSQYDESQKEVIFKSEKYSVLADNKDFIELKSKAKEYSIEEIEKECKVIFADYVLSLSDFSLEDEPRNTKVNIPLNQNEVKKPYGGHFEKYLKIN
jgi:hypothetical protein